MRHIVLITVAFLSVSAFAQEQFAGASAQDNVPAAAQQDALQTILWASLPDAPSATTQNQQPTPHDQSTGGRPISQVDSRTGSPTESKPPDKHRFLDRSNILLTGAVALSHAADSVTTQHALSKFVVVCPQGPASCYRYPLFREKNPIARPFVELGWPGEITYNGLNVATSLLLQYALHRTNHHRIERLVPLVFIAGSVEGTVRGARYW